MDYARILRFKQKMEEFERVGFAAFIKQDPNELTPLNIDYYHVQVVDLSSSPSLLIEQFVQDSDSKDYTNMMAKYSSLNPSFLDCEPNMMFEAKNATATSRMEVRKGAGQEVKWFDDGEAIGWSRQTGKETTKVPLRRYKTLGHKSKVSSADFGSTR
ncbi:hypothetical protein ACOSP7_026683 [Xanthoceras sorbifolium]